MAYTPTTWLSGDTITAAKMNKIEQGITSSGIRVITINGLSTPLATIESGLAVTDFLNVCFFDSNANVYERPRLIDDLSANATPCYEFSVYNGYYYYIISTGEIVSSNPNGGGIS